MRRHIIPLPADESCRSDLLSISLGGDGDRKVDGEDDGDGDGGVYVETRWNMVGSLTASPWLFWKPRIDVVGRTKFWFRREEGGPAAGDEGGGYRVYFYDESWEITELELKRAKQNIHKLFSDALMDHTIDRSILLICLSPLRELP